jgi:hypothetical protein
LSARTDAPTVGGWPIRVGAVTSAICGLAQPAIDNDDPSEKGKGGAMRRSPMSQSEILTACALVVATCLVMIAAVLVVDKLGGPKVPWASSATRSIDEPEEAAARTDTPGTPDASEEAPSAEPAVDEVVDPSTPGNDADDAPAGDAPAPDPADLLGDLILPTPIVGRISVPRSTIPPPTSPPITVPPVTKPPTTLPPTTQPPVTEPPVTEPPITEPPVTDPPPTDPPPTDPPATDPGSSPTDIFDQIHDLIDLLLP